MTQTAAPLGTEPTAPPASPPTLKPGELSRWIWRTLTSMRTALILLFMLAVAAVPGSLVPQRRVDQLAVTRWQALHPQLTPIYQKVGLFDVYSSVWFSAIYILLMLSLIGCVLPRVRLYYRAAKAQPPAVPRHLTRMPLHRTAKTTRTPDQVMSAAADHLRRRHYRLVRATGEAATLSAQRGYLREAGNLGFHLSLLVVLVAFAYGSMFGFRGGAIVITGQGFSNIRDSYDEYSPGTRFDENGLTPFSFILDKFDVAFTRSGPQAGMPTTFKASLTVRDSPGAPKRHEELQVNHPLTIGNTSIFLVGHGYAPIVTVRDGNGDITYSGPTVFLPRDSTLASIGVVKAPDAKPTQLGFEGMFYPTYNSAPKVGAFSRFPDALAPILSLTAYTGDLGMDDGLPQSVYVLNKTELDPVTRNNGKPLVINLGMGQTRKLPNGQGSITFNGLRRWTKLQMSETPGERIALGGVFMGLLGMLGSLFIRPRRVWVKAHPDTDSTAVEVAGLERSPGGRLAQDLDLLVSELVKENP